MEWSAEGSDKCRNKEEEAAGTGANAALHQHGVVAVGLRVDHTRLHTAPSESCFGDLLAGRCWLAASPCHPYRTEGAGWQSSGRQALTTRRVEGRLFWRDQRGGEATHTI